MGWVKPIASCLLPIASCLLPIAYCLLPIAYCLLPLAYPFLPLKTSVERPFQKAAIATDGHDGDRF